MLSFTYGENTTQLDFTKLTRILLVLDVNILEAYHLPCPILDAVTAALHIHFRCRSVALFVRFWRDQNFQNKLPIFCANITFRSELFRGNGRLLIIM